MDENIDLKEVLRLHERWINDDKDGRRADLSGANIEEDIFVDVIYFSSNTERDAYLKKAVKAITEELSWDCARPIGRTEPKIEECGQLITYAWEEK